MPNPSHSGVIPGPSFRDHSDAYRGAPCDTGDLTELIVCKQAPFPYSLAPQEYLKDDFVIFLNFMDVGENRNRQDMPPRSCGWERLRQLAWLCAECHAIG